MNQCGRGRDAGCPAPRTDPYEQHYRIRLLLRVVGVEARGFAFAPSCSHYGELAQPGIGHVAGEWHTRQRCQRVDGETLALCRRLPRRSGRPASSCRRLGVKECVADGQRRDRQYSDGFGVSPAARLANAWCVAKLMEYESE